MIGYVMVGTNDLTKATKFYDTILVPLGLLQAERTATYTAYAPNGSKDAVEFYVTIPFNQKFATHGNGTMIALSAPTMLALKQFHRLGLSSGGTDEGAPGLREEGLRAPGNPRSRARRRADSCPVSGSPPWAAQRLIFQAASARA